MTLHGVAKGTEDPRRFASIISKSLGNKEREISMLPSLSKRLPSVVAAHLQSPAALPAISVAASKVHVASAFALGRRPLLQQSRMKSAPSTASAVHDESSMFDSYYLHDAKNSSLLHPCGDVHPEKFFPEESQTAHAAGSGSSQPKPRDHRQEKVCPHSDLTHLEGPYHQYAYYPKLVSDLTTVSRLLYQHGRGRRDVLNSVSDMTMGRNVSPRFNIVRDDAKRTVIEIDVANYRPEDVTAQIENGNVLHVKGIARGSDGNHNETMRFAKKFVLDNVDEEGVTATIEDGLLTIGLPKFGEERAKVRNIPIV